MARHWKDVQSDAQVRGLVSKDRVAELKRKMLAETRAHRLAEVREAYGLNQTQVAQQIGITQSRVSRIENGDLDRSEIGTVRSYVEALGGEVEIVARFGDERITVG